MMGRPIRSLTPNWPYAQTHYSGLYVAVDGLDASGRSTLAATMHSALQSHGYPSMVTGPFPSKKSQAHNTLIKHDRRLDATSRHLLYSSYFAIVSEQVILPFLNSGYIVISDRSWISLYARAVAQGIDQTWARNTLGFALLPDLVIEPYSTPLLSARRKLSKSEALDPVESVESADRLEGFLEFQTRLDHVLQSMRQESFWSVVPSSLDDATAVADLVRRMEAESEELPS